MDGASRYGRLLPIAGKSLCCILAVAVAAVATVYGLKEKASLTQGNGFKVPTSLAATNVLITGASSGIGYSTAALMCRMSANLMLHGPNEQRTRRAVQEMQKAHPNVCDATATVAELDDYKQAEADAQSGRTSKMTEEFGTNFTASTAPVHVLLLNAGLHYGGPPGKGEKGDYQRKRLLGHDDSYFVSKHGQDRAMAVNHFGHFLLTVLLMPILAPDVRIVLLTGGGMWAGDWRRLVTPYRVPWEKFRLRGHMAYFDSKLANVCMGRELRRRLPDATVVVNDPGLITTGMTLERDMKTYSQRRFGAVKEKEQWFRWSMPAGDAAERLLQSTYVTKPVPDLVYSYWLPQELMSWVQHHGLIPQGYFRRSKWLDFFLNRQLWSFGPLYAGIGPGCGDENFMDFHWNFSLTQTGLAGPAMHEAVEAYRRSHLAGTPEIPELRR